MHELISLIARSRNYRRRIPNFIRYVKDGDGVFRVRVAYLSTLISFIRPSINKALGIMHILVSGSTAYAVHIHWVGDIEKNDPAVAREVFSLFVGIIRVESYATYRHGIVQFCVNDNIMCSSLTMSVDRKITTVKLLGAQRFNLRQEVYPRHH